VRTLVLPIGGVVRLKVVAGAAAGRLDLFYPFAVLLDGNREILHRHLVQKGWSRFPAAEKVALALLEADSDSAGYGV
jgi:hypothetical protein